MLTIGSYLIKYLPPAAAFRFELNFLQLLTNFAGQNRDSKRARLLLLTVCTEKKITKQTRQFSNSVNMNDRSPRKGNFDEPNLLTTLYGTYSQNELCILLVCKIRKTVISFLPIAVSFNLASVQSFLTSEYPPLNEVLINI